MRVALALALAATAASPPAPAPPAAVSAAEDLSAAVGSPADGRRALVLDVEAPVPSLAQAVETALSAALGRRGYSVAPLRGEKDPEARARADGADWLLRVRAGVVPGARELALVGEVIPTWPSFFLQRQPGARALPPRMVQARAEADAVTALLARPAAERGVAMRPLARVPGRVLALAAGDAGAGPALLAVTPGEVLLLSPAGAVLARRALDAAARAPVRDPGATAAIGDFGGGRLAWAVAGGPPGEVSAARDGRLEPVAPLGAAPLCAGDAGTLFGAFVPGTGLLRDALWRHAEPGDPRSPRDLVAVAAAPRGGTVAYGALAADGRLELLGPDLRPAAPPLERVGAGFALADLDGDGTAEVIASRAEPGAEDRVRVLAPLAPAPARFESGPIPGAILAGAAADLTGDGLDDAALAAVVSSGRGRAETVIWLVSTDAREPR